MRTRCDIGKVIVCLYENYKKAEKSKIVKKPVSYALYETWKYVDSIEEERKLKNDS